MDIEEAIAQSPQYIQDSPIVKAMVELIQSQTEQIQGQAEQIQGQAVRSQKVMAKVKCKN